MRTILLCFLPMLTAAVLVVLGGLVLSKKEMEVRTPVDQARLLDFSETFGAELQRLEKIQLQHLDRLSLSAVIENREKVKNLAAELNGVRAVSVFRAKGKSFDLKVNSMGGGLPEVLLEGERSPLKPARDLVLDPAIFLAKDFGDARWVSSPDETHQLYCSHPYSETLVAVLIDSNALEESVASHLASWTKIPMTPLLEVGDRVCIQSGKGAVVAKVGSENHGPAAAFIPFRTTFGVWEIKTWDGLDVTVEHDPVILTLAGIGCVVLLMSGALLFLQQRRALRLAEERVSFVNRVSHELGSPLTNIALNLDLANETLDKSDAKPAKRRLSLAMEEIERLSRLVANVLTFSRKERKTLELKLEAIVPDECIQRVVDSFRPSLERKNMEVELDLQTKKSALLDPDALEQVIGNLVSNVEKYAVEGGWLGLESNYVGDDLIIVVRDRGPGIPLSDQDRIFIPFERVHSGLNEGASGTGLGLSIARELAARMNGMLALIESADGAAFELRIPACLTLSVVSEKGETAA